MTPACGRAKQSRFWLQATQQGRHAPSGRSGGKAARPVRGGLLSDRRDTCIQRHDGVDCGYELIFN